ncbi:MAG: Wzz/FepE/Etk N-terminal domain-containing protein, partial [Myxococcota bacterium]
MNVEAGLQLDLLGALRRRVGVVAVVVAASVLAAYWIAMALPNYYDSAATIFVEPQAINQELVKSGVASYDIGYRVSLMSAQILSRPRLSRVIDDLGLYPDESKTMLREEIINLMRSRIEVLPIDTSLGERGRDDPGLSTFIVKFRHKDPQLAAAVAQRVANDFVKEHIEERVGMTRTSLEFVETELGRLSGEYAAVQDQITQVKNANTGHLPADQGTNQRILDRTLAELREGTRVLDLARSNKAFWDGQALSAAAVLDPRDDASPLRRLQLLELRLAEYRSRGFTDRHPDMIQAEQELGEVRVQLKSLEDADPDDTQAPTLAQQNAESQRERAALEVELAVKEVERLRSSSGDVEERLALTPKVAEALGQLENRLSRLAGDVELFSRRQLQAKVQVDMER